MSPTDKRGTFIVFEGCDRSGKTTQVTRLVERLNKEGRSAEMLRFPDRTTGVGSIISAYLGRKEELHDRAVHLLFSANRWELERRIVSSLEAGTHVLVDRYAYSGVAFSAAKPGLSLEWCKQSDRGLPRPDLVCFLEVSEEAAASRADWGGERYELTEFQRAVRDNYSKLRGPDWVTVSGEGGLEQVEQALYSVVETVLAGDRSGELGRLWEEESTGS